MHFDLWIARIQWCFFLFLELLMTVTSLSPLFLKQQNKCCLVFVHSSRRNLRISIENVFRPRKEKCRCDMTDIILRGYNRSSHITGCSVNNIGIERHMGCLGHLNGHVAEVVRRLLWQMTGQPGHCHGKCPALLLKQC